MNDEVQDMKMVEAAGFRPMYKMTAQVTITALHLIRKIATDRGVSMDKITGQDLIDGLLSEQRANDAWKS